MVWKEKIAQKKKRMDLVKEGDCEGKRQI